LVPAYYRWQRECGKGDKGGRRYDEGKGRRDGKGREEEVLALVGLVELGKEVQAKGRERVRRGRLDGLGQGGDVDEGHGWLVAGLEDGDDDGDNDGYLVYVDGLIETAVMEGKEQGYEEEGERPNGGCADCRLPFDDGARVSKQR